jgi:N-acetylmuramic acid 6-phosphate etherase
MGAGTAQKIALNMLSVLVGLRLGHVHEGYMVNVVADNAKLIDRAARIVAALSGADRGAAEAALARTGGAVKPAVLIAAGATPEAAAAALDIHRGHLGPALAEVTG